MPNQNFSEDLREFANGALLGTLPAGAVAPTTPGPTVAAKAEDAPHASGDVGIPHWGVRNDLGSTTLTSTNGDYSPIAVDARGIQYTRNLDPGTGTITATVLTAATSAIILAANFTNRRGATIYNRSGQEVFVAFGATASATAFSVALADKAYYEVPFGYTGTISALSTLAGAAPGVLVTQLT